MMVVATGSMKHGTPTEVQIIKTIGTKGGIDLDVKALESILHHEKCRDRPVAVVSIGGALRKGKSFMLNFFIRYLAHLEAKQHHTEGLSHDSYDWLGNHKKSLTGFKWRGGSKPATVGILMWSEPFVIRTNDRKEIAVLLMDAQGLFDSDTSKYRVKYLHSQL